MDFLIILGMASNLLSIPAELLASIADELEGLPGVVGCVDVEYRRGRDILPYGKR